MRWRDEAGPDRAATSELRLADLPVRPLRLRREFFAGDVDPHYANPCRLKPTGISRKDDRRRVVLPGGPSRTCPAIEIHGVNPCKTILWAKNYSYRRIPRQRRTPIKICLSTHPSRQT